MKLIRNGALLCLSVLFLVGCMGSGSAPKDYLPPGNKSVVGHKYSRAKSTRRSYARSKRRKRSYVRTKQAKTTSSRRRIAQLKEKKGV